jgi:hypothetical protein
MSIPTVADIMAMPNLGIGDVVIYKHNLLGEIEATVTGIEYDDFQEPDGHKRKPEHNWFVNFEFELNGKKCKMGVRASQLIRKGVL